MTRLLFLLPLTLLAACSTTLARSASLSDRAGVYAGDGQMIAFNVRQAGPQAMLQYTDVQGGAARLLIEDEDGVFNAGAMLLPDGEAAIEIRFSRGSVQVCEAGDEACQHGERVPIRRQDVEIRSADLVLHGTVWLPPDDGRHAAIVIAQGSEEGDRNGIDPIPQVFAAAGYAVLSYDKRGVGDSTGDWQSAGIEDLAADFLAAVELMARHPSVDARRIGYLGFSEGGWVVAEASRHRPPAVLIALSGGAGTKGESYIYKNRRVLEEQGLSGEELSTALQSSVDEVEAAQMRSERGEGSGFDRRISYDPRSAWRTANFPVLWIGGAYDVLQDQEAAGAELDGLLQESGNSDHRVVLLPRANHALFVTTSPMPSAWQRMQGVTGYHPDFWPALLDWTAARLHE